MKKVTRPRAWRRFLGGKREVLPEKTTRRVLSAVTTILPCTMGCVSSTLVMESAGTARTWFTLTYTSSTSSATDASGAGSCNHTGFLGREERTWTPSSWRHWIGYWSRSSYVTLRPTRPYPPRTGSRHYRKWMTGNTYCQS